MGCTVSIIERNGTVLIHKIKTWTDNGNIIKLKNILLKIF